MWLFVIFGLGLLGLGLAGARGVLPANIGLLSLAGFFFCLCCAVLLGYKSRQVALEDRTRSSSTTMLVMMAAMLKDENNETLERIAARGGPAGDAARMILDQRRETLPAHGRIAGKDDQ